MRLVTDVASGNHFHTDLNGFQVRSHLFQSEPPLGEPFLLICGPGADAAAPDALQTPPAGQLLPNDVGGVLAGLVVSFDSVVGSESGRRLAETR